MYYLDNSATTQVNSEVIMAVSDSLAQLFANPSSLYIHGAQSESAISAARITMAKALGCGDNEVYFTSCGSESNNLAILAAVKARRAWADNIICTGFEHPSVYLPVKQLEEFGFKINFVMPSQSGEIDIEQMAGFVNSKTALVCCMHVNNEIGAVQDVAKLAQLVKAKNSRTGIHVDGVQAFLKIPFNLSKTQIDTYSVSGHKLNAPKGVGALYIRKGYNLSPIYLGGGQEKGVRCGTENTPYIVGFAKAAEIKLNSIESNARYVKALNDELRQRLSEISCITINSPQNALEYIINFTVDNIRSETMLHFLESKDIFVSSGSACSKGEKSHTLSAMKLPNSRIDGALRVSFAADTDLSAPRVLCEAICEGITRLAKVKK